MKKIHYPGLNFLFLLISIFVSQSTFSQRVLVDYKPPSEWSWGVEDSTEYFIYTPGNLKLGNKYPIVLYLHGCCGESPQAIPHRAADPPVRMWHNFEKNSQEIPTYIISPQTTRGWKQHFESIKKVIDFLVQKRQGDSQRIYIVGFSMGGRGLFDFISLYPDYFAAAIPIGMSFSNGNFEKIKDIPTWANQGSEDWFARDLYRFVKDTRALNGLELDSAWEWVTGVNPRYTSLDGLKHLVQWEVATRQDLTGWAYEKVNDGNKYPQIYFETPQYHEKVNIDESYTVKINAYDFDGSISKVEFYLNKKYHSTLTEEPYDVKVIPIIGDNSLEAIAYDDKGKKNTARTLLVVDSSPELRISNLPYGRIGAYYNYKIPAIGNGDLTFNGEGFPKGITLLKDGQIKGIPIESGSFKINIIAKDVDGDSSSSILNFNVLERRSGEVLVTKANDSYGNSLMISKMIKGETPNFIFNSEPSLYLENYSFSDLSGYDGVTFIKSEANDSTVADETYMSFVVDRDVEIIVGYEKMDNLYESTIPEWLTKFERQEESEIITQIRYYNVFSKRYNKGKIIIPGGDKKGNRVATNYFVMVKPEEFYNDPEINIDYLPFGLQNIYYEGVLSTLYGHGDLSWSLSSGSLPEGLSLSINGMITGFPISSGIHEFEVTVSDENGKSFTSGVSLEIK